MAAGKGESGGRSKELRKSHPKIGYPTFAIGTRHSQKRIRSRVRDKECRSGRALGECRATRSAIKSRRFGQASNSLKALIARKGVNCTFANSGGGIAREGGKMTENRIASEQGGPIPEEQDSRRDPEDRSLGEGNVQEMRRRRREKALDKTLADSFPTSDPPSSIPDPGEADPYAA